MARLDEIRALVPDDVLLVEDAAQSQGASRRGRRSGAVGDLAATSFYPGKNLGAYGDAGAVTTGDDGTAAEVRALRNHGGTLKYEHRLLGTNSRLDTLQAVVLSAKLDRLEEWNGLRGAAAHRYEEMLTGIEAVTVPRVVDGNEHVWHLYVVRVPERDRVLAALNAAGIGAGIHYPLPVHLLPAFTSLGRGVGDFPHAERAAAEILSLPLFPGITVEQQERVVTCLRVALRC
jgi:dTDP-4-amino-4,6-dideoxygalactose transaminase